MCRLHNAYLHLCRKHTTHMSYSAPCFMINPGGNQCSITSYQTSFNKGNSFDGKIRPAD